MTSADLIPMLVVAGPLSAVVLACLVALPLPPRRLDRIGGVGGLGVGAIASTLAVIALARGTRSTGDGWWTVDFPGGVFLAVVAVVGAASAWLSQAYLAQAFRGGSGAGASRRVYWVAFYLFWAALIAVPVIGNLGVAWVLIESTTAASAVLVAHSGRRSALEAGWKYLVLTSMGLTVALLGMVILVGGASGSTHGLATLDWGPLGDAALAVDHRVALTTFVLMVAGLAAKVGWAPVHNWLPDAHSEAPPPVSAMLSAALLPAVALIAWRVSAAMRPALGDRAVSAVFVGFGLLSLAVAVPFLWRPLPWKRLLAYSSLEHMGVLALAIGFHHPLATAGAVIHVAGHAVAKSLGFYATTPILRYQPSAARRPPRGLPRTSPSLGVAAGIALWCLGGLPPSPLFVSELLVLYGGFATGMPGPAIVAALLLALGFLGLAHVLIEALAGARSGRRPARPRTLRYVTVMSAAAAVVLLALVVAAYVVAHSSVGEVLA